MFERFTADARQVVVLAQQEARELHHSHIGTEHLLLALLAEGSSPAAQALRGHGLELTELRRRVAALSDPGLDGDALAVLGIDLEEVRRATEASFGEGALDAKAHRSGLKGHIPFSDGAKKVLELSLREAIHLKQHHILAGHILLGLLREGRGSAARILLEAGIDLAELRSEVVRLISSEAA